MGLGSEAKFRVDRDVVIVMCETGRWPGPLLVGRQHGTYRRCLASS